MKTNLLSCFILCFFVLTFTSCNPKKALEDKINETIAEEIAGAAMGTDVETSNITNADKATAQIGVTVDGNSLNFEKAQPIFNIVKGNDGITMAFTLTETKENAQNSIQIGIIGKPELFKSPLTAQITTEDKENELKASFNIMYLNEDGIRMVMTKSGTLKVVSFSDDEVVLEIDAMGGETADVAEDKNLKPIKGKIVCKSPLMTFIGLKKEEIF
jgi:hypothetical protein